MSEVVNTNIEKLFFAKILDDPAQFYKVEPFFFRNDQIRFIYEVIRDNYINSKDKVVPSAKQIWTMVSIHDTEKTITKEVLKLLLTEDTNDVAPEWLDKRFKAWKSSNHTRNKVVEAIDLIQKMDEIDYDNVMDIVGRLKESFNEIDVIGNDDEDLGDDFDDPDSHKQMVSMRKMSTGYSNMDKIMGGGWDHATFNIIMGETNVGKSMWLQNLSAKLADEGKNVIIVTLEMAKHKVMKRIGAMRFRVDVNDYDDISKDSIFIKNKINELKNMSTSNKLFDGGKPGKIFVKKYPTSDCTVTDLENYIKKFEEVKKLKIDVMLIDYINLMSIEKGYNLDTMLYLKGKHLAEGLRRLGDKYDICMITATQTDKSVWGANDINLDDIPESKAIAESADSVWAIIRNPQMKKENTYRLKILKLRDGEHHEEQIKFDFNTKFLTMENDVLIGSK
jgi:Straboviridae DNA replication helicase